MPRVKLSPNYADMILRDRLRKIPQKRLADIWGVSQPRVSQKLREMDLSLDEFRAVIKEAGLSDEFIVKIVKGG